MKKNNLPASLRRLINRKSHACGIAYSEQTKSRLIAESEKLLSGGGTLADVIRFVESFK